MWEGGHDNWKKHERGCEGAWQDFILMCVLGIQRGIHSTIIQVVHCMICVIACILYVDKNDKLKTHYRQKGAYTHDYLLVESRLHTMGWRLFKKHKPINLFSHVQMVSSRFSNAVRGFGFFPPQAGYH